MTPQEFEALQKQVANLTQQIAGVAAERNQYRQELEAAQAQLAQAGPGRSVPGNPGNWNHPLGALGLENPQSVDDYYLQLMEQRLLSQKGYLTKQEAEQLAEAKAAAYAQQVMGNALVWRTVDKLTARDEYKDLGKLDSELSKRTSRILQERNYGRPLSDKARGFDEYQYRELGDLQYAADLAHMELEKEAKAAAASTASASAAQGAAHVGDSPAAGTGGTAPAGSGRPDFASATDVDDVLAKLDAATPAPPR